MATQGPAAVDVGTTTLVVNRPIDRSPTPVAPGPGTTGQIVTAPTPIGPPESAPPSVTPGPGSGQSTGSTAAATPAVIELPVDTTGGSSTNPNIIPTVPNYIEVLADGTIIVQNTTALNFTGSGVTATANGSTATLTISSGGTANKIFNGTSYANIPTANGNVSIGVGGSIWTFGTNGVLSATGNITTTANISGAYFIGNGSQLTGIAASYGNANVAANLAAFGTNPISTAGNITGGNISTGVITLTNSSIIKDTAGNAIAIGRSAGDYPAQGINAVAVGNTAGNYLQGNSAVAVGDRSGGYTQGISAVAVGQFAGNYLQGASAVAIGNSAGLTGQGVAAVAIGAGAGATNQGNNSIILNATAANLEQTTANTFTVAPVRNDVANTGQVVFYNTTSKEITYGNVISVAGNITAGYFFGNGSQLTGITGSYGNANVVANLAALGSNPISTTGNITGGNILAGSGVISTGGNVNGATFNGSVAFTTGTVSGSGNITGGNIAVSGVLLSTNTVSATGNVTGGNINTGGNISTTGNVIALDIRVGPGITGGTISALGNITSANTLNGAGLSLSGNVVSALVSAANITTTANISGGNILGTHVGNVTGTTVSVTGNITGGNLNAAGLSLSSNVVSALVSAANITTTANISGGNLITGALTSTASLSVTGNTATITTANISIGYLNIPQISFAANATAALVDSGKHYYTTSASNLALTLADNSAVSWPVGTALSIVNRGTANVTVAPAAGVSLYLAGNSSSANRVVTTYGMATVMNVAANIWMINGTVV